MQKIFRWNIDKNELLKQQRNVSFEMVVEAVNNDKLIEIIQHPNKEIP
jgi:hypothetical protein